VRGETAAQSLNDSIDTAPGALKNTAIVNDALQGLERHDLSGLVASTAKVTRALGRNEDSLKGFVTNFNTTLAALASRQTELRQSIALLGPTLEHTDSALTHLDASFPNTRAFAREILPGVRETPATIDAAFPWIAQTRKLVSQAELGGLVKELKPTTVDLANLANATLTALPQADLVAQCVTNVILPTGDIKIQDGPFTSNEENYKEFWYTMVGLAGESQNFDGNGHYVRFAVGGGNQTISTGKYGGGEKLFANVDEPPIGTRPAYTSKRPPYRHDQPCKDQKVPDLNSAKTGAADGSGGNTTTAIPPSSLIPSTTVPALPTLPVASAKSGAKDDLAAELVDRLNPFRAVKK
jgi:hypothetical protein